MYVIRAKNVNDALFFGTHLIEAAGSPRKSRAGDVLEVPEPVTTVYRNPMERVLWSPERDANPYFHFFESLWMLEGRNDLEFPRYLLKRMEEFSDDGVTLQGAYGHRWINWFGVNQLAHIIALLRADPDTRRAVLTMWDPTDLTERVHSKDIPCNTHIYFKMRRGLLEMTVCNRSNDMLWGAYGANAVHMSMLQEYIAMWVGVPVGSYYQMSDNFHVYTTGPGGELWSRVRDAKRTADPYIRWKPYPMSSPSYGTGTDNWAMSSRAFFNEFDRRSSFMSSHPFWSAVVSPMWKSFRDRSVREAERIAAVDWREACVAWLKRRNKPRKGELEEER